MIIWICAIIIMIGLAAGFFVIAGKNKSAGLGALGVVSAVIVLLIIISIIVIPLDYRHFENKHMLQKEYYANFLESNDESIPVHLYADIFETNNELAEYQASKITWGVASLIPDRVMDLEPILIK